MRWDSLKLSAPRDEELAATMRKFKVKAPVEQIVRTDILATAINRQKLGSDIRKRIVDLECGHKEITTNITRAPCSQCHAMILNGEDYEAFRNRDVGDT